MKKRINWRTARKTIKTIKRLPNSSMGNPAFEITFTTGQAVRTKANISDAYIIHPGMEGRSVNVEIETTKSGKQRIVSIDY